MANARLAEHIVTDFSSEQCGQWIMEQLEKLRDACPVTYQKTEIEAARKNIELHLKGYRAHRAEGDPEKRLHRDLLLKCVKRAVSDLASHVRPKITGNYPYHKDALEKAAADVIEAKIWKEPCAYCGRVVYDCIKTEEGVCYCKECIQRCAKKCASCEKWHSQGMSRVRDSKNLNADNDKYLCVPCYKKLGNKFSCTCCGNSYHGPVFADKYLTEEERENRGWRLCQACANAVMRCICGEIDFHFTSIHVPPNHEEDADNEGRGREHEPVQKVCDKCRRKIEKLRDIHFAASVSCLKGKVFTNIKSQRQYGIELEVCSAPNLDKLPKEIQKYFSTHEDRSLPVTGIEILSVPMSGDEGLEVVKHLCEFAAGNDWRVNGRAGMHLHMDMNEVGHEARAALALAYLQTYEIWSCFVAPPRVNGRFSQRFNFDRDMVKKFLTMDAVDFIAYLSPNRGEPQDRYKWVNWNALHKHGTVEIRSHQGTLDFDKIQSWVKAHLRFADWCIDKGTRDSVNRVFAQDKIMNSCRNGFLYMTQAIWKDRKMGRWFRDRAQKFQYKGKGAQCLPPSLRKMRKAGIPPVLTIG